MNPSLRAAGCVKVYADSLRKTIRLLTFLTGLRYEYLRKITIYTERRK